MGILLFSDVTGRIWDRSDTQDSRGDQEANGENLTGGPLPHEETKSQAEQLLEQMSLEEKVGQMFLVRCPKEDAVSKISSLHIGGYLLFSRDFRDKSKAEAARTVQSYQDSAEIPLFIGVDEEGGSVNRISLFPAFRAVPFHSPQSLYQEGGWPLIISDTKEKCDLLKELGINVNFAPVCDVSEDPEDYIYQRSFGQNAKQTAVYAATVTETMKENGVAPVLKHFPGYGNNIDTHTGVAHDSRPYAQFISSDFLPFQAGIDAGADIILISHNIVECMDPDFPASLSKKVHHILRSDLGYPGVIITDDLYMDAIREFAGDEAAAVLAVLAGNDLLCCTDFEVQIPAVIAAVHSGQISQERIDESVLRILELKINMGLIANQ
ncbi:glycoside hydrolase family 3 protein [Bacilliculturomica massiliensis]|uniref:glycoside hydrolase family 3 protein n=1 Tax=Bacilliculturomica massiliensis TaxID=1917867 RepID=UPI001FE3D070|nr:glycoside hydrolase family 3 N-terminal domain-containing protein [Bacilliculturomica massiliensis]